MCTCKVIKILNYIHAFINVLYLKVASNKGKSIINEKWLETKLRVTVKENFE